MKLQSAVFAPRLLLPLLIILATGLGILYSVTHPVSYELGDARDSYTISRSFFERQLVWVALGLVAMLAGASIPFWVYKDTLAWVLYGLGLAVLILVLLLPPMRGGTHRWLVVGPLGFQPSEFVKIVMIVVLAAFLAGQRRDHRRVEVGG